MTYLDLDALAEILQEIRTDVLVLSQSFAHIEESDRSHISPPPALIDAWVHLTLALVTFPAKEWRSIELAKKARSDIHTGMAQITAAQTPPLQVNDLAVLPCDLVALMSMKLTKNVTPRLPDISSTYSSYLDSIVRSPLDHWL